MKKNIINTHAHTFNEYLVDRFPNFTSEIINALIEEGNDVFLFSGIIRDYFLYKDIRLDFSVRDLDIVVFDINKFKASIGRKIDYKRNSFGGLKLYFNDINIDIWQADSTWGLNIINETKIDKDIIKTLPETVFFNCSSVLFDFKNEKFIENKNNSFQFFIENKILDIVLEENPLPELCILNTIYYAQKHDLKISEKLAGYVENQFAQIKKERLLSIQRKHFEKIIYEVSQLHSEIKKISNYIK
ncbi:hypothetical protein [Morganella morganii]|uniref:hypothetical protein n=1 Tax=Morganella morganii TaxID=582 RepID=UPI0034D4B96E